MQQSPPKILASVYYEDFYPFDKLFAGVRVIKSPQQLDGVSAIVLWGGEDISPSIYGQHPISKPYSGPARISYRDAVEVACANEARRRGIPIIGICRGAQMMCALSGGTLFQHVNGHAGREHPITTADGRELMTNSLHHQMMNLKTVDHKLIAWVEHPISDVYLSEEGPISGPEKEPEIIYIPRSKALCIQGHPEYIHREDNPFLKYSLELVEQYVLNKTME